MPQPVASERVRERCERLPSRRPVEPSRRRGIAVDVRDHARRDARELLAEYGERSLLRSLREHRVGPERTQLARDAKRQQRVEGEPVEHARPNRPHELEARIRSAPATRARRALGRRARPTVRRTSARATARAAACSASGRPSGAASSSDCPLELGLDRREDRLLRVARHRSCRSLGTAARAVHRPRRTARSPPRAPRRPRAGRADRSRRLSRPREPHPRPSR